MVEQLLDLAQVRARAEELGGEDIPERVRRDVDAARVDVGAKDLAEVGVLECMLQCSDA